MTAGIRYSIENPGDFISSLNASTGIWSWSDLSMESMARLWYDGTDVSADRATVEADNGHNGTPYGFIPYSGYVDYTATVVPDMGVFMFYTSQTDIPV